MKCGIYREDGWVALVEVINDLSDDHIEVYRLQVLAVLQGEENVAWDLRDIFSAWKGRKYAGPGMWHLENVEDYSTCTACQSTTPLRAWLNFRTNEWHQCPACGVAYKVIRPELS